MADIDEELLLLAGDASSEDGETSSKSSEAGSAKFAPRRDTSPVKRNGKGSRELVNRKRSRQAFRGDSEEDGEDSSGSSSPKSQRSAPMEESESDSEQSPTKAADEEVDRYPLEGKYRDRADQMEIMAMPEIKREEILAERAHEVERERQNRALRQLLKLKARESGNYKNENKRKANVAELEESHRKTSRQRTKAGGGKFGEASTGIDSLKRARAEKDDRQRRRQQDRDRNVGDNHGSYPEQNSEIDADGDSELEWDDTKPKVDKSSSPVPVDTQPAELRDVERIRVGRSRFAQVCYYPGFDAAITGCYVRISVGQDPETHQNVYRMAIVKGFTEGRPYSMVATNGKSFVTTQYVLAAHGKAQKEWPLITCSDSAFTEAEWHRYKQTCLVENIPPPSKSKISNKIDNINQLVNRSWTEAELQEKLNRSGALKNKYLSLERNRLNNLIREAKNAGYDERLTELRAELDALDGPKLAFNTSMHASPVKVPRAAELTQQERLAILNRDNRRKNAEEVRQAQIKERRAVMAVEAAMARGELVVEDHSRRVRTRAKFKHDVADTLGRKEGGRSGTHSPGMGTPGLTAKQEMASLPLTEKLQPAIHDRDGIATIRRPLFDDDIIGAIDLNIDIEL